MTLEQIRRSEADVLTCNDVAPILKCNPYTLHLQATQRPELLGFPVIVVGNRVKIPRLAFIRFMKGEMRPEK